MGGHSIRAQGGIGESSRLCNGAPPARLIHACMPCRLVIWGGRPCQQRFHHPCLEPLLQASDQGGAPLGLAALLAALPRLCAAAGSAQPGTVVTQEVGALSNQHSKHAASA